MKELFEQVIQRREYDLKSLLTCIDQYHIEGKLTDDERQELTQAAREGATAEYDYAGEINALWAAVRALQQSISPTAEDCQHEQYDVAGGVQRVEIFLLKQHRNRRILLLQAPHPADAVNQVSGKSAEGFRNNHVNPAR